MRGDRRSGIHRLQSGRRTARPRGRGDRARQPHHRPPGEPRPGARERREAVVEDIRDGTRWPPLLEEEKPEVVFHLAAQIDVRVSAAEPAFDAEINVIGTINMLEAARRGHAAVRLRLDRRRDLRRDRRRSAAARGHGERAARPLRPGKYAGEGYVALWKRLHGLSTVSLRFGNVYGPRQDPLGEAGVIAIFCGKLLSGGQPTVFGDGRQTRDYVFVDDVVRVHARRGRSDVDGAYNVGRGQERCSTWSSSSAELGGRDSSRLRRRPPRRGAAEQHRPIPREGRARLGAQVDPADGMRSTLESAQ